MLRLFCFAICFLIISCDKQPTSNDVDLTSSNKEIIKLNQLGYLPHAKKIAIVPNIEQAEFKVIYKGDNSVAYKSTLSKSASWDLSDEKVSIADFSALTKPGTYEIVIKGAETSHPFTISNTIYDDVHDASIKAFYYNRSSFELTKKYAGKFAREAGHLDQNIMIHESAASENRPTGTLFPSPKGWYDAGDFGKYVVNSGISTYTLLMAYKHHSDFYNQRNLDIPESNDNIADLLNEIKWNVDWLVTMQDPGDGGVYHKLTTLNFAGSVMPNMGTEQRYVYQKSTAAALNFAAVMALSSRVFEGIDQYKTESTQYRLTAINAWKWAMANPNKPYIQPDDVFTGKYDDEFLEDEFSWAAAEMFLLTQESRYLEHFKSIDIPLGSPSWANTSALGYISLLSDGQSLLNENDMTAIKAKYFAYADQFMAQKTAYNATLIKNDFVWGGNAVILNKAFVLIQAYRDSGKVEYLNASQDLVDYIFGRNPTGYSFVTGYGSKVPMHIHHRQSEADDVVEPIPGFLAGGAQNGHQDKCNYTSDTPAGSYLDDFCSYSTNEITINWNAPLVYMLATLVDKQ